MTQRDSAPRRINFVPRSAGRETAVFLLFLLAAAVLTWPLLIRLPTAVSDLGDPLLNAWILDWVCHALAHAPLQLFDAPAFYPSLYPLAYSENMVGVALLVLPFHLLGASPIALHNIAMILGFALSGYGAYVLGRMVTRSTVAGILAGLFFAFVSFKFDHLAHLQIICSGWLPLLFAALFHWRREPSVRRAALVAGAFLMNALTNIHFFLFGSLTLALTIVFWLIAGPRIDRRAWLRLFAALAIAALLFAPLLVPYRIVSERYDMKRGKGESMGGSAVWSDWLRAGGRSVLYARFNSPGGEPERALFPGLMILFLSGAAYLLVLREDRGGSQLPVAGSRYAVRALDAAILLTAIAAYIGAATDQFEWTFLGATILRFDTADIATTLLVILIAARLAIAMPQALGGGTLRTAVARSRFGIEQLSAALWIVIGVLGSLGLNAFFHDFLFRRTGIFRSVRAPARWAIIAYLGLAVWGAVGASEILRRRVGWRRAAVAALLLVFGIADIWPFIKWEQVVPDPAPVYRWLARTKPGPLLELPASNFGVQYLYMLANSAHRQPIYDGISGFEPPITRWLRERGEKYEFSDHYMKVLEVTGCRLIVVHPDWLYDQVPSAFQFLRRHVASGRLGFVRRFDSGINGDWVFAVTRNVPEWQTLRAPEVPDPAGFTPAQNLDRLLVTHQPTYSGATFGRVESPRNVTEVKGELHLSGWALSPHGIARVRVLVDAGRHEYDAQLFPRDDISRLFPWYPRTTRPAFLLTMRRPKGVKRETDVQVEIIDGAGNVTRLPDVLVWWD